MRLTHVVEQALVVGSVRQPSFDDVGPEVVDRASQLPVIGTGHLTGLLHLTSLLGGRDDTHGEHERTGGHDGAHADHRPEPRAHRARVPSASHVRSPPS